MKPKMVLEFEFRDVEGRKSMRIAGLDFDFCLENKEKSKLKILYIIDSEEGIMWKEYAQPFSRFKFARVSCLNKRSSLVHAVNSALAMWINLCDPDMKAFK